MKNVVLCAIYLYLCQFLLLNIIIPFIMYIFTLVDNPYKESYASLKKCSRCVKKLFTISLFYYMMTQTIIDIIYSVWN